MVLRNREGFCSMAIPLLEDEKTTLEQRFRKFLFIAVGLATAIYCGWATTDRVEELAEKLPEGNPFSILVVDAFVIHLEAAGVVLGFSLLYYSIVWLLRKARGDGPENPEELKWFALEKNPVFSAARYTGLVFVASAALTAAYFITISIRAFFGIPGVVIFWVAFFSIEEYVRRTWKKKKA